MVGLDKPDFVLRPHQVVDAKWMADMSSGIVKGCITANYVGIGKTFTCLTAVYVAARKKELRIEATGVLE